MQKLQNTATVRLIQLNKMLKYRPCFSSFFNKIGLLIIVATLFSRVASAQCEVENKAFQGGEQIDFELYFSWKFLWKRVGTGHFVTTATQHQGESAYHIKLLTETEGFVDQFFRMRDTLSCIVSDKLKPLYYRKAAAEGHNFYIDEAVYSYPKGKTHVKMTQVKNLTTRRFGEETTSECIFDMISMMCRARSWDADSFREGQKIRFQMVDGAKVVPELLIYRGKENVEAKDGHTYRCLVFSFYEEKKGKNNKEVVRFFITDDLNHVPIRLDLNLNFGSAKAFFKRARNIKHPFDSQID